MPTSPTLPKRLLRAGLALAAASLAACTHETPASGADVALAPMTSGASQLLAPPPAGRGVQFSMLTTLEPGVEAEHCRFVLGPPEGMLAQHDEVRYTSGGHHVLLYDTPYDKIPTRTRDGASIDTSGVFDCSDGATDAWEVTKLIAGSQNGLHSSTLSLPEGVAVRVRPNAVLLINAHYLNPTPEPIHPQVLINLHTVPESELKQEGDVLFIYNPLIDVPAGARARARMRCPVNSDITLVNVQSHMHRRGVGYGVSLLGQAPFYEHDRWQDVPVEDFGAGMRIAAGQSFDYHCDYENAESRDIAQGPRSTDEMCMLIGSYYPIDLTTSACLTAGGERSAAEWVGDGTASCKQTFECAQASWGKGLQPLSKCMQQADPGVAKEASDLLRCALDADDAAAACPRELAACLER